MSMNRQIFNPQINARMKDENLYTDYQKYKNIGVGNLEQLREKIKAPEINEKEEKENEIKAPIVNDLKATQQEKKNTNNNFSLPEKKIEKIEINIKQVKFNKKRAFSY